MPDLSVREASAHDADTIAKVIRVAFETPALPSADGPTPPDTGATVVEALSRSGGLVCGLDGTTVGALLFEDHGMALGLRRVSTLPSARWSEVLGALVEKAERVAAARGYDDVCVLVGPELPETSTALSSRSYTEVAQPGETGSMVKALGAEVAAPTAEAAANLGRRLAGLLRAGDLVILSGALGAGKTTLAQGVGAGLGVRGEVTSPTFVISRVHPSLGAGPGLVHVDAFRLGDGAELDDLDLDASIEESVTLVEWGEGIAEALSANRLHVHLSRARGGDVGGGPSGGDEPRVISVTPVGARWVGAGVRSALAGVPSRGA